MGGRRSIRPKDLQYPDRILSNMLKDYVEGTFDESPVLNRALVVSVDQVGGVLETDPPNPRNSIKAKVISSARDKETPEEELGVYWPIFSHDIMPIKPGEHVYVLWEDPIEKTHGLWLCRIPTPKIVGGQPIESSNLVLGTAQYSEDESVSDIGIDAAVQDSETPVATPLPADFISEASVPFRARVGDRVIEGSNNTIIVLGLDRTTDENTPAPSAGAGSVDIVAGRADPENMNLANDKSRIIVSSKTSPDANFSIPDSVGSPIADKPAIVINSENIRIVASNKGGTPSFRIYVQDGDINIFGANVKVQATTALTLEAPAINLGQDADQPAVLGTILKDDILAKIIEGLLNHIHPTGVGPSGPPAAGSPGAIPQATQAQTALARVLSAITKVKP